MRPDRLPSTATRIALSVAAVALFGVANAALTPAVTLLSGENARRQFENTDTAYLTASYVMGGTRVLGLTGVALLAVLACIWFAPLRRRFGRRAPFMAALAALALTATPARAYYDKQDYTEAVTIYPNETAFWIPDNGGNKDSQGRMESADYYNSNKVALKRFIVPHVQLSGSGWGPWGNYFVPAGRLILVDRTPYNREWTKATNRGTAARDESFPCQDRDGHDVTVEVTIGTSVSENDAAKFLYRFGVKPPTGDRTRPELVFTSVFYGRTLTEVMDTVGRGKVQALACSEISTRSLDAVNADAAVELAGIETKARAFFGDYGITLDYIGWAGTFTFDSGVQDAINRRFIAEKDRDIAQVLAPFAGVIQQLAAAEALRTFGTRTDGHLPTTIVGLPTDVGGLLRGLLSAPPVPAVAPK